jgi:hypothetical protein
MRTGGGHKPVAMLVSADGKIVEELGKSGVNTKDPEALRAALLDPDIRQASAQVIPLLPIK